MSQTTDEAWEHTSCWMCRHLIYDLGIGKYRCTLLNKTIERKYDVYKPTECESYDQG